MSSPTKFIINRNTWLRGETGVSVLYRKEDKLMCCLGQIGHQCGLSKRSMEGIATPSHVEKYEKFPASLLNKYDHRERKYSEDSALGEDMMEVNDDDSINDKEREKKLRKLAKEGGFRLEFVNGKAPR